VNAIRENNEVAGALERAASNRRDIAMSLKMSRQGF